jgi:low affinity Fe/Cu permease
MKASARYDLATLMLVIPNTQSRGTASLHIKLDELILVTQKARNKLLDDVELEKMKKAYGRMAREKVTPTKSRCRRGAATKRASSRRRKG